MAQYAAELYHDDDAIKYAARAVELSPEDANGHQKLGEMYRRRQDIPHAIAEFRQAIAKNDRLFPVYFDLAELLLSSGQVDEADRLFRRVVRASPDEELVARAARMSMQVNLGKGTLESLERELLPVAVGNPQKSVYRRLLVELYGAMTFPLVQKVKHSNPRSKAAADARAELAKIGARAVKPLLDALGDDREAQQKIAIEVLAYVENKSAGPALYNYAIGVADKSLRVRAMIACGALRDPAMLARYEQILAPKDGEASVLPSDAIAVAAAWGVARLAEAGMADARAAKQAEPLLVKLLGSASPDVRALSALGLGLSRNKKYAPALLALAKSPEAGPIARAAATHALGVLGDAGTSGKSSRVQVVEISDLLALADAGDPLLRQAALLTMARLGDKGREDKPSGESEAIARGIFSEDDDVRRAAVVAAATLATGTWASAREALPVPDGPLSLREVLLEQQPDERPANERAAALIALTPSLRKAAVAAVSTSPERARVVADALLSGEDKLRLTPLVGPLDKLDPELEPKAAASIEAIAKAAVPGFVALERHPMLEVRTRAVELLAQRPEPEAQRAVIDALSDPEESVRRAALAALGPVKSAPTITAVAQILKSSTSWPLRVRAAEALGRLGTAGAESSQKEILETLTQAAKGDEYALVREAALRASAKLDAVGAKPLLEDLAAHDLEPRVRQSASELLKKP